MQTLIVVRSAPVSMVTPAPPVMVTLLLPMLHRKV
jgi:hypothetical protein